MGLPTKADLLLYQGDTWAAKVVITGIDGSTPPDITDYTTLSQIRAGDADSAEVAAVITAVVTGPQEIHLSIGTDESTKLNGDYSWDLQITSPDAAAVTTIMAGKVRADPEVSR